MGVAAWCCEGVLQEKMLVHFGEIDGITRKVTLELPQSRQEEWAKRSAVVS